MTAPHACCLLRQWTVMTPFVVLKLRLRARRLRLLPEPAPRRGASRRPFRLPAAAPCVAAPAVAPSPAIQPDEIRLDTRRDDTAAAVHAALETDGASHVAPAGHRPVGRRAPLPLQT